MSNKKREIVNVRYENGNFYCSYNQLTSLKDCPQNVSGIFPCSENLLTSLEKGPKTIIGDFDCSHNQLINLEGSPKKVGGVFNCSDNPNLEDISDIPSSSKIIRINNCPKIKKFPPKIDSTLEFCGPTDEVRQRIKEVLIYEVIQDNIHGITVRQKSIGEQLLDGL